MRYRLAFTVLLAAALSGGPAVAQQKTTLSLAVKNHRFQPKELHAPANVPIALRVKNLDASRMEFESVTLRVEKVIGPNAEAVIDIRPLGPGRYEFYDDFNQQADGVLVVR
jgi:hypothetical protein